MIKTFFEVLLVMFGLIWFGLVLMRRKMVYELYGIDTDGSYRRKR